MKSGNITVTDDRLKKALSNTVNSVMVEDINKSIKNATDQSKIRMGTLVKVYPYLDKVSVQLDNGGLVLCKVLHKYAGNIIDFFTPEGDYSFCDTLKEPCLLPRSNLPCLVADINSEDSEEYVLLGYYISDEIIGLNPSTEGNFKIYSITGDDQSSIGFGNEGFNVGNQETIKNGDFVKDYYNKDDVDSLIKNLRDEIRNIELNDSSHYENILNLLSNVSSSESSINLDLLKEELLQNIHSQLSSSFLNDVNIESKDNTLKLILKIME